MFTNPVILQILKHYEKIWAIGTFKALSGWDLEVTMPEKGADKRESNGTIIFIATRFVIRSKVFRTYRKRKY
ncbi:MAG: hypothetical protein O2871_02220 [bacterium]|nr:hypothetical protein [bacterium]